MRTENRDYFYFLQIEKHKEVAKYWGLIQTEYGVSLNY